VDRKRQGGEDLARSAQPRRASVDWRAMCLELASLVDLHRRERMIEDKKAAWKLARDILEIEEAIDSR
jgi:hypothetical protein